MCILIFSTTLSESFPIRRRIQRDIFINVHTSSCTVPALRFFFFRNWIFSTDFLKAPKYKILLRRTTLLPLLIAPSERPPEEKQYTHTHTHTHIYIYIYIYFKSAHSGEIPFHQQSTKIYYHCMEGRTSIFLLIFSSAHWSIQIVDFVTQMAKLKACWKRV